MPPANVSNARMILHLDCKIDPSQLPPLQNLALNIAEKGFPISVYNRSVEKTELAVKRAGKE
eukprot:scaffold599347_cov52-Prasinocladus_malaysianus.AAC.1